MGKLEDSLKMRELTEERFREENPMDERFILLEWFACWFADHFS